MTRLSSLLVLIPCVILTACANEQSVKQQIGIGRNSPDEFTVIKRAPLSLPPDYNLRPPVPGAPPLAEQDTTLTAQQNILGTAVNTTSADQGFLERLGATTADPNIRATLEAENRALAEQQQSAVDRLINIANDKTPEPKDAVVDPKAERARIQTTLEEGAPINTGDVPVVTKPKRK